VGGWVCVGSLIPRLAFVERGNEPGCKARVWVSLCLFGCGGDGWLEGVEKVVCMGVGGGGHIQ